MTTTTMMMMMMMVSGNRPQDLVCLLDMCTYQTSQNSDINSKCYPQEGLEIMEFAG